MDVTRLRAIMHRYKEAGLLLVGAYLVGHHLWTKRRITLLTTPVTLLILACWMAGALKGPPPTPKLAMVPALPHAVRLPEIPSPVYRPQKPLLSHASKVLALDSHYHEHLWISADHLLLVTHAKPPHKFDPDDPSGELDGWQGQANLLDLRTGRYRKLEELTRVFNRMQATPGYFEMSPGGKWLKWINYVTPDGWPNPAVARLDGSGFQQWDQDKASDTYWLDDDRWIEEERRSFDDTKDTKSVIVHNPNRKTTSVLKLTSKAGQTVAHAHYAACDHAFETSFEPDTPLMGSVKIVEKRAAADEDTMPPLHTYTIPMPLGADVQQILVTPQTRRVLYVLRFHQVAEGIQPQPEDDVFDLWSSRLDGSDLKDLGYVEASELDYSVEEALMTAQSMIKLEWLPDGRHFSFIYRKNLYRAAGY